MKKSKSLPSVSELTKRIETLERKLGIRHVSKARIPSFLDLVRKLDPITLQEILREVRSVTIGLAIIGLSDKETETVKSALSKNRWAEVVLFLSTTDEMLQVRHVNDAHQIVVDKAMEMDNRGFITIVGSGGTATGATSHDTFMKNLKRKDPEVVRWIETTFKKYKKP